MLMVEADNLVWRLRAATGYDWGELDAAPAPVPVGYSQRKFPGPKEMKLSVEKQLYRRRKGCEEGETRIASSPGFARGSALRHLSLQVGDLALLQWRTAPARIVCSSCPKFTGQRRMEKNEKTHEDCEDCDDV
ncbi:unnamed protein product [Merluccius merluccius]